MLKLTLVHALTKIGIDSTAHFELFSPGKSLRNGNCNAPT